jgi:hypothetical protein
MAREMEDIAESNKKALVDLGRECAAELDLHKRMWLRDNLPSGVRESIVRRVQQVVLRAISFEFGPPYAQTPQPRIDYKATPEGFNQVVRTEISNYEHRIHGLTRPQVADGFMLGFESATPQMTLATSRPPETEHAL